MVGLWRALEGKRKGVRFTDAPALAPQKIIEKLLLEYAASRREGERIAAQKASEIVEDVRKRGFAAVADWTWKLDGMELTLQNTSVSEEEIEEANGLLPDSERLAMLEMKGRIESFARVQKKSLGDVVQRTGDGTAKLVFRPVERAGIYVPAGRFPLFSSLFMAAVTAREAGVKGITLCSPPRQGGKIDQMILAAARMCGIGQVFKIGGAQAIAALAFGIEGLIKPVDVVCGPGNEFVSAGKQLAAARGTRIDVPAGPSDVLVIADDEANPAFAAADMLAQAEHGDGSAAICICVSQGMAEKISGELLRKLNSLPEGSAARKSIPAWGRIFVADSMEDALRASDLIAPEHLELLVKDAEGLVRKIRNAGAVFVRTAETFCDYGMGGGTHILP